MFRTDKMIRKVFVVIIEGFKLCSQRVNAQTTRVIRQRSSNSAFKRMTTAYHTCLSAGGIS